MVLKKFGDLKPGDVILGTDGREVTVVEAYDEHVPESMYEIEMEDGSVVKASGNHLWYIETSLDYQMHRQRRAIGKELLKDLSVEQISKLLDIAEDSSNNIIETSLIDMVILIGRKDNQRNIHMLERIASSLGPIAESNVMYRDYETNEDIDDLTTTVRHYDAVLFAQQILTLSGKKEFRKRWNLIAGQVVTTCDMLSIAKDIDIPVCESKE